MGSRVFDGLLHALRPFVSTITARTLVESAMRRQRLNRDLLEQHGITPALREAVERGLSMYLGDARQRNLCRRALADLVEMGPNAKGAAAPGPERIPVRTERDVVLARSKARTMAAALGFNSTEQVKIVTAVSELSRNIFAYAGEGEILLRTPRNGLRGIEIVAKDHGPGISNLEEIFSGWFKSKSGMGLGLKGCKLLMTHFDVQSAPGQGTCVTMSKIL